MPTGFYWGLLLLLPLLALYSALGAKGQTWLLLIASITLIAWWDARFALLIVTTTGISFVVVNQLDWDLPDERRLRWLWIGVGADVTVLMLFRYLRVSPVGLSFYTLARMTHLFDVYYRFERPSRSFVELLTFTSFFPLLISGPIERSSRLLPCFARRREVSIEGVYEGAWLILLGLFQKVVIADRCGILVGRFLLHGSGTLLTLLGIIGYALQIFADFSGYSDVARGVARLFGIEVMANFRAPYFSRNLTEYWRRWHISLSTWLDDYLYKPTAMRVRDWGLAGAIAATVLTFFVSALWHGRGSTFLVWGAIHAMGVSVFMSTRSLRKWLKSKLPARLLVAAATSLTFTTVSIGYVFFRAPSVSAALATFAELARPFPLKLPERDDGLELVALSLCVAVVHQLQLKTDDRSWLEARPVWLRAVCYAAMLFFIARLPGESQAFIYFQF